MLKDEENEDHDAETSNAEEIKEENEEVPPIVPPNRKGKYIILADDEEKDEEVEPSVVTKNSKDKEKVFIDEESETEKEQDLDAVIEAAVTGATSTIRERTNLLDFFAKITVDKPNTVTPLTSTIKKTLTKTFATTPKVFSKRKGVPSGSTAILQAPEEL